MMTEYIRLTQVYNNGRYGISRGNGSASFLLGPGITDPLPGWDWCLNREHPLVELEMSVSGPGSRNSFRINPRNPNTANIIKEVSRIALQR
jgi:hypothetical protein